VIGVVIVVSCASSGASSAGRDESLTATETEERKKTQQEVQSELMAFSDRFFAGTLEAAKTLEGALETPESRYVAAAARLVGLMATTDIAASPNPGAALLDMTVYVTLKRMVWEAYWMPEVYGEAGRPVLETLRELEDDIWDITAGVYTPEQLAELRQLIDDWRAQHPDTVAVDFMRLGELGESRQVLALMDVGRSGGMLAPVKEANRNLEEMRLLAERLAFMATRVQLMMSLQVEMASAKLAVQPEVQQLLEDSRRLTEASKNAAEAFATLATDLPEERRAAIDQILKGLGEEREQIFAELGDEEGELRPALHDVRETLEVGRNLAVELGETARNIDALMARMMAGNPKSPRPFDILEYQATFAELSATAREVQAVLDSIQSILSSADIERQINPILEGANRLENEFIDRAFTRGIALIVVFFVVLTTYRLLMRRVMPELGSKPTEAR
jgi:hypothetical protein